MTRWAKGRGVPPGGCTASPLAWRIARRALGIYMAGALEKRDYLLGDTFSAADILLSAATVWIPSRKAT